MIKITIKNNDNFIRFKLFLIKLLLIMLFKVRIRNELFKIILGLQNYIREYKICLSLID